jgi:hypothetical protein
MEGKILSYRDLEVWKNGVKPAKEIYRLTETFLRCPLGQTSILCLCVGADIHLCPINKGTSKYFGRQQENEQKI